MYYAKLGTNLVEPEAWQQAPMDNSIDSYLGRLRCQVPVKEKGIYKWRVVINGEQVPCANCFVRVVPTGKVSLVNTLMSDLSQNMYKGS